MTTSAPTATKDFTLGFRAAHAAFRRDAARLVRAVARVASADESAAVAAWFDRYAQILVQHHQIEDEIWWPLLGSTNGGFDTTEAAMLDDHHHLVEALETARAALDQLAAAPVAAPAEARRKAAAATVELNRILTAHLDSEEAAVFPVIAEASTAVLEEAERRSGKRDSLSSLRFVLPWALDDTEPGLASEITATLPAVLRRFLGRWDRRYRRQIATFLTLAR